MADIWQTYCPEFGLHLYTTCLLIAIDLFVACLLHLASLLALLIAFE